MKKRLGPLLFGTSMIISVHTLAADLKWQVFGDLGARYESNPTKVESGDEQDDTAVRGRVGGRLYQDTEFFFLDLEYQGTHTSWVDDTFDDRNTLEGYGQLAWQPADFFTFFINNRRQDLIVAQGVSDTQDNRTVRSTTEVGALFTGRLGRVDTLNIAPIYRAVKFGGDGVDSKRPGVLAFWGHRFSETDRMTVNLFAERIDYDTEAIQNDVDRAQAFLGYTSTLNRLSYELEGGYTWVQGNDDRNEDDVDDSDNDYSGPLIRAYVNYDHENHLFQLRAFQDLTDTSIGLNDSTVGGLDYNTRDSNVLELALVTRYQVDLNYNLTFAAEQWDWQIGYRYDQQDVETPATDISLARDQQRDRVYTTLNYEMTKKINARLLGSYERSEYEDFEFLPDGVATGESFGREDDLYRLGLIFTFRIFKYGFINVGAEQERRYSQSESPSSRANDYVDNKIFANFRMEFPVLPGRRGGFSGRRGASSNRYGL